MTGIERVFRDFIVGVRLHGKAPLVTACAIIILSLGVAATTASFAFLNALFIRPLPVRDAGRLVRVYQHTANRPQYFPISYSEFEEAALAAWTAVRGILYDVGPFDPLTIGLAPAVLLIVCAIAAWVPSRRAARMSAAAALRYE